MEREIDVVIIGAGQAGLAMSYELEQARIGHLLLERGAAVGESWTHRYESLRTITPNWMNALPGLPFPGPQDEFATRDDIVDYLVRYAGNFHPPILFDHAVTRVTASGSGFLVETKKGRFRAGHIIAATGPFQKPWQPQFAHKGKAFQIHSDGFVSERDLPSGSVLVVGSGNSGVQIATELSAQREVWLARERDFSLPRRLSGLEFQALLEKIGVTDRRVELSNESEEADLMWWMQRMGLYDMPTDSAFGRLLANGVDPYIGQSISVVAAEHGFRLLPRVVDAEAEAYLFEDGSTVRPDIVIWATGYRFDYGWASDLPVTDVDGIPLQQDGVSPVAGFYFLGLRWMRRADSGLLKGVGRDAAFLTKTISHRLNHTTAVRA